MTVRVGDFVPAAYEAHVLVFHHEDDDGGPPTPEPVLVRALEGTSRTPRQWATLPKLHLPERAYLLFRAPVAKVVDLAVGFACLAYYGKAQGTWPEAVNEAGHRVPVDPASLPGSPKASPARRDGCRSPNLVAGRPRMGRRHCDRQGRHSSPARTTLSTRS
jgi:hypothetical protein